MESMVVLVLYVKQCPQAALSRALSFTQSVRQRELIEIETFGWALCGFLLCSTLFSSRSLNTVNGMGVMLTTME